MPARAVEILYTSSTNNPEVQNNERSNHPKKLPRDQNPATGADNPKRHRKRSNTDTRGDQKPRAAPCQCDQKRRLMPLLIGIVVSRLRRWHEEGVDVERRLPLSHTGSSRSEQRRWFKYTARAGR